MVTVEIAFGLVGLAAVVYFLIGCCAIVIVQLRCVDAAGEITRQAARDDQAAITRIVDGLPGQASVTRLDHDEAVRARVAIAFRPWGRWLFPVTVSADAETRREGGAP
jgi:hypothetical protein